MFPRSFFPAPYWPSAYAVTGVPASLPDQGGFSDSGITEVRVVRNEGDLYVTWKADPALYPPGTIYQVYINYVLRWFDTTTRAMIPGVGSAGENLIIHVGKVGPENQDISYADRLDAPDGPGNRASLAWYGGQWIDNDLIGFAIYQSLAPGQPVYLLNPVDTIPASVGDVWGDGFGRGPFGRGPFGRGIVPYRWTSAPLAKGSWQFAVAPIDQAGSIPEDIPVVTLEITGPPDPVPEVNGRRVWVESLDAAAGTAQLSWNV